MMNTVGGPLQRSNWEEVVERVVRLSEGSAPDGVQSESEQLDGEEAEQVERQMEELVNSRKRAQRETGKKGGARKAAARPARKKGARKSVTKNKRARAAKGRGARAQDASRVIPDAIDAVSSLAASALSVATQALGKAGATRKGAR